MRVKKLNNNRRPKAGDDDAASTSSGGDSEAPWTASASAKDLDVIASPTNATGYRCADSPTDPSAAPALQPHDVSELDLNRQSAYAAASMANAIATATAAVNGNANTDDWRDRVDRSLREGVHAKIVEYLTSLKPNAPTKVLDKLPGLAYRMEDALFHLAHRENEYCDQSTLPQRLTLIQQANAKRLLQQQCPAVSPKDKDPTSTRKPLREEQARVVFSCLQSWRQKLVNMYSAAPWEILPNPILAKVAVFIPATTQELVMCGVPNPQLDRFGNSLLQEIDKIMNALNANANAAAAAAMLQQQHTRSMSPSATKRPPPTKAHAATKKRKTATAESAASAPRLAAAPPASFLSAASLIRPIDPTFIAAATSAAAASTTLPALLPSGPLSSTATRGSSTTPFFPRIPVPSSSSMDQSDSRMHLLAQGVGQLSKQHEQQQQQQSSAKSADAYEKEILTLRWLLQESQREKAMLEAEVQRLRQQGAK